MSRDEAPSGENGADESDATPGVEGGKTGLQGSEDAENERLADLEARLDDFGASLRSAWDEIEDLQEQLEDEREERRRLEEENDDLREELSQLDARTDLLRLVQAGGDDLTAEQRQVAMIQHLQKAARKQQERDRDPKASLNASQALALLNYPYRDDSQVYHDMERAVRLLGNEDVLWKDGGYGDTRLKLDLTAGDVPASISGRD